MVRRRGSDGRVPAPNAVGSVAHACGRRVQEAPVNGSARGVVAVWAARLISEVSLVGRFQVDDGPGWRILPMLHRRPGVNPAQRVGVVAVSTLVNDEVEPGLITEALPGPAHAHRVSRDRRVGSSAECRSRDAFPALATESFVRMVARDDPDDVIGPVARLQVANQADHFRLRQGVSGVYGAQPPGENDRRQQPVGVYRVNSLVQATVEAGIHPDPVLFLEAEELERRGRQSGEK